MWCPSTAHHLFASLLAVSFNNEWLGGNATARKARQQSQYVLLLSFAGSPSFATSILRLIQHRALLSRSSKIGVRRQEKEESLLTFRNHRVNENSLVDNTLHLSRNMSKTSRRQGRTVTKCRLRTFDFRESIDDWCQKRVAKTHKEVAAIICRAW